MFKKIIILLLIPSLTYALGTVTGGQPTRKNTSTFFASDSGQPIFGVRNDGASVLTPQDLAYGPLSMDNKGRLQTGAVLQPSPENGVSSSGGVVNGASLFKVIAGIDNTGLVRPVHLDSNNNVLVSTGNSGQATEVTQTSVLNSLVSINGSLSGIATLAEQVTQETSLQALQVGQTTANTSLASIDAKLAVSNTSLAQINTSLMSAANSLLNVATLAEQVTQENILTGINNKLGATLLTNQVGRTVVQFFRQDYSSTSVTTLAYTQLLAPTPVDINEVEIFDSCGESLKIAFGASGSEVDKLSVSPGGNGRIPLFIPSSTRVSMKAVSNDCTAGENLVNFYR